MFILHFLFWMVYSYFGLIQFDSSTPYFFNFIKPEAHLISFAIVFFATFYLNYLFVLPKLFEKFNWKRVVLGMLILFVFFISVRYLIEEVLMVFLIGHSNYFEGTSSVFYIYDNLYYGSFPIILSTVFYIIVFNIRLLEYNKYIIEEKRTTEVKFLKAQLNPHFVFNTLNNIYSLVYFESEKALPAIEKLSELMRYTTYEIQKENINLQEEINYIKSYIELDQLRQKNERNINFKIAMEDSVVHLPPFLLSPLVENALKHGKAVKGSEILIDLKKQGNVLSFTVSNEIGNHKTDKLGGIGLDNLRKSLEINYPNAHSLVLKQEQQTFTAHLEINLNGEPN